jgi:hypothetical protein
MGERHVRGERVGWGRRCGKSSPAVAVGRFKLWLGPALI